MIRVVRAHGRSSRGGGGPPYDSPGEDIDDEGDIDEPRQVAT
jgi:hypothetical protein